jgi:hypothetical protein
VDDLLVVQFRSIIVAAWPQYMQLDWHFVGNGPQRHQFLFAA